MPYISTEPVESSNIERIGYHRKQQILRIIFQGNRAYDYPMVTERDFDDLMAAESKGRFLNSRIKPMYAPRTPREAELVEPCCEHDGPDPTCIEECYPCHEWCCTGDSASPEQIANAIAGGLELGGRLSKKTDEETTSQTEEEKLAEFNAVNAAAEDGSFTQPSQKEDCPHGKNGRTCAEGCGCIPCHVPQDESPEVQTHSKALNEMHEIKEEEETNGNSD